MNVNSKLQLTKRTYNRDGMTDENSLVKALATQPAQLSVAMTNLGATLSNQFPVSFLTEGLNKIEYLDKNEYYYPVIDNINRAIPIAKNLFQAGDTPGKGFTEFKLYFADKFAKGYTIISSKQKKARVMEDAREVAPGVWEHKCRIPGATSSSEFFPLDQLAVGKMFAQAYYTTSLSGSRGSESFSENPYQMQNQMSLIRKSYKYEGEIPKEVANFAFPTGDGTSSNMWFDWEQFQYTQQWRQEQELLLWENEYNKDKDGRINIRDKDSGKVIPNGSGIFEQIVNKDTYGNFTAKKLKSVIRDAFFGTSGSEKKNITMFTGTGGREVFGEAMLEAHKGLGLIQVQRQLSDSGVLEYRDPASYFDVYVTQEGHRVSVMTHPMFDNGPAALASDLHPTTGLPEFSYKMVFLDRSVYDGKDNIIMVAKKGLEFQRAVIQGVGATPDGDSPTVRSSDFHGSSVQFMAQKGVQIRRATNCFMLDFKQTAYL